MESMRRSLRVIGAFSLAVALIASALGSPVRAQDEMGELQDPRYPVAIHLGTCDEPEEQPLFELSEAALPGIDTEAEDFRVIGPENVVPVMMSDTTIDATFAEFEGEDNHVLAVHRSWDEYGTLVACGPVGGLIAGDRMTFGLNALDDSGVSGVVEFQETEDEQLNVRVNLLVDVERAIEQTGAQATPVADGTPAAVAAVDEDGDDQNGGTADILEQATVTLELYDVGFDPAEFTIQSNEDVAIALNNTGESMHNFSIDELDISVDVGPGQTLGVNINADPGEYTFYCNVAGHREAGMEGTLFVAE